MSVTAVILCGGKGTRLKGVLPEGTPKCLAPVAGRPFLSYILGHLINQGVRDVVLCVGVGAGVVDAAFGYHYPSGASWGVDIRYSREEYPLDTGGALKNALPLLDTETVLVVNGDTYCPFRLKPLLEEHLNWGWQGTVLTAPQENLLSARCGQQIDTGVFLVSRKVIEDTQGRFIPPYPIICYHTQCEAYGRLNRRPSGYPFLDIGTPEDYAKAEGFLREQGAIA